MSFFEDASDRTMYAGLSDEIRESLRRLFELKELAHIHSIQLLRMKKEMLDNPTPAREAAIHEYNDNHIVPLEERMTELGAELAAKIVDTEEVKKVVPLALMGLMQHVNLELLFECMGTDPRRARMMMKGLQQFYEEGFQS